MARAVDIKSEDPGLSPSSSCQLHHLEWINHTLFLHMQNTNGNSSTQKDCSSHKMAVKVLCKIKLFQNVRQLSLDDFWKFLKKVLSTHQHHKKKNANKTFHSKGSARLRLREMPGRQSRETETNRIASSLLGHWVSQHWELPTSRLSISLNRYISLTEKWAHKHVNWNLQHEKILNDTFDLKNTYFVQLTCFLNKYEDNNMVLPNFLHYQLGFS